MDVPAPAFRTGQRIKLRLINPEGRQTEALGTLRVDGAAIFADIPVGTCRRLCSPLDLELVPSLIEPMPGGEDTTLQYRGEIRRSILIPPEFWTTETVFDCVCPIFLKIDGILESIGSGVLIQIGRTPFLLTMAHVTDQEHETNLLVPGGATLVPVTGYSNSIALPVSGNREDDRYDISYYELDPEIADLIALNFTFLDSNSVHLGDEAALGDHYSFAGYPWRKSEIRGITAESQFFTMTGQAIAPIRYSTLNYKPHDHIIIKFNRLKAKSQSGAPAAPLPHGMSGGGIFSWPKTLDPESNPAEAKLTGICMAYNRGQHLLIGTRLHCFVACIKQDYPHLPIK